MMFDYSDKVILILCHCEKRSDACPELAEGKQFPSSALQPVSYAVVEIPWPPLGSGSE
jgi:hypothetical protein